MFNIVKRQQPMFDLTSLRDLAKICEIVFQFELIVGRGISDFDLNTTLRVNEFNRKIFYANKENYQIELQDYFERLETIDVFEAARSALNISHINRFDKILDLTNLNKAHQEITPGEHICVLDRDFVPENISHSIMMNGNIAVQTGLLKYDYYDRYTGKILGLVSIV